MDTVRFTERFLCEDLLGAQAYAMREGFQHLDFGETCPRSDGEARRSVDPLEEFYAFRLDIVVDAYGMTHHVGFEAHRFIMRITQDKKSGEPQLWLQVRRFIWGLVLLVLTIAGFFVLIL